MINENEKQKNKTKQNLWIELLNLKVHFMVAFKAASDKIKVKIRNYKPILMNDLWNLNSNPKKEL